MHPFAVECLLSVHLYVWMYKTQTKQETQQDDESQGNNFYRSNEKSAGASVVMKRSFNEICWQLVEVRSAVSGTRRRERKARMSSGSHRLQDEAKRRKKKQSKKKDETRHYEAIQVQLNYLPDKMHANAAGCGDFFLLQWPSSRIIVDAPMALTINRRYLGRMTLLYRKR